MNTHEIRMNTHEIRMKYADLNTHEYAATDAYYAYYAYLLIRRILGFTSNTHVLYASCRVSCRVIYLKCNLLAATT